MERMLLLLAAAIFLLTGCSGDLGAEKAYQYFELIEGNGWSVDDELFYSSSELKPNNLYNVYLVMRLDRDISYESIPIGVTFETPKRKLTTRVVRVPILRMQDGKGGYNIFEQTTPLEQGVEFPDMGVYTYSLRHLSTDSIVKGVVEVGLVIEPVR